MQLPEGMIAAIVASFRDAEAHVGRPDDGERISFAARAGSPISGSLFSLATIPLVEEFCRALGRDSVYFFADDAAVLIKRMDQLPTLFEIFQRFRAASGLSLKATKCKLIPLRRHDCDEQRNIRRHERWLAELTPGWAGFQVVGEATYLGFRIGPSASDDDKWADPVKKFSARALDMARSKRRRLRRFTTTGCSSSLSSPMWRRWYQSVERYRMRTRWLHSDCCTCHARLCRRSSADSCRRLAFSR